MERTHPNELEQAINWTDFIEETFENVRRRQNGETQGISSKAKQKFLSGKLAWKSSARRKPIANWKRMLKKAKRIVLINALQKIGSASAA